MVVTPAASEMRLIWRYPATLTLLAIAVGTSAAFTFVFGFAELGLIADTHTVLRTMSLPGMLSGLIVGVVTKSLIGEFVGFWVGMASSYGLPGFALDLAWQTILRLRRYLAQ